jgi:hypothetical protein
MMIRDDHEVLAFRDAADRFCLLLESDPLDRELWIGNVLSAVADVYARAHKLPSNLELDVDPPDDFDVGDDDYYQVVRRVHSVLAEQSYYWSYFDPTEMDSSEKPDCGDLGDDLADIYRDLKPGLRAWRTDRDEYLAAIVFDWRDAPFQAHWGVHAVDAMRALHWIVHQKLQ